MTPDDLRSRSFSSSRRGYDRDEVDSMLDRAAAALAELDARVTSLDAQLSQLREEEPPTVSADPLEAYRSLGEKTTAILVQAETAAAELRDTAAAETAAQRARADAETTTQRTEADEYAAGVTAAADERAAEVNAAADERAAEVNAAADERAAEVNAAADQRATEVNAAADERAAEVTEAAEARAADIVRLAEANAQETTTAALEAARTTTEQARRQAEQDVAAAERAARERVETASAHARRLVEEAEAERDGVLAEAARVGDARDRLVAELRAAVSVVEAEAGLIDESERLPTDGAPAPAAAPAPAPAPTDAPAEPVVDDMPADAAAASDEPEAPAAASASEDLAEDTSGESGAAAVPAAPGLGTMVVEAEDAGAETVDDVPDDGAVALTTDDAVEVAEPVSDDAVAVDDAAPAAAEVAADVAVEDAVAEDERTDGVADDVDETDPVADVDVRDVPDADRGVSDEPGREADRGVPVEAAVAAAAAATPGAASDAAVDDSDAVLLRERSLVAVRPGMLRGLRRGLQDLQSQVLASLREQARGGEVDSLLPPEARSGELVELASPFLDAAFRAGRADAPVLLGGTPDADAPGDQVRSGASAISMAVGLVDTVRTTLRPSLAAGLAAGEPDASLSERVGEVFRDMKGPVVESAVEHHLVHSYGMGMLTAWSDRGDVTSVSWVLGDEVRCPEGACRANATEGPVGLLAPFPSGQVTPPLHDGCTCALAPVTD
jgi:DivIVA domain-containing protein